MATWSDTDIWSDSESWFDVASSPVSSTVSKVLSGGMKAIVTNRINSVTADSEDSNYPALNVLDDHPKRKFKADGDYFANLTIDIAAGTNSLAIFGTNAKAVKAVITDPNKVKWGAESSWDDENEWAYSEPTISVVVEQSGEASTLWASYDYIDAPMEIVLTLVTTIGTTIEAGVIRAGEAVGFKNPKYGLQEGRIDYSIVRELNNGATWNKSRDKVRTFSGQLLVGRDTEFYDFMTTIASDKGLGVPLAWLLVGGDSMNWCVFARFADMPSGSHDHLSHSNINFSLIEVL